MGYKRRTYHFILLVRMQCISWGITYIHSVWLVLLTFMILVMMTSIWAIEKCSDFPISICLPGEELCYFGIIQVQFSVFSCEPCFRTFNEHFNYYWRKIAWCPYRKPAFRFVYADIFNQSFIQLFQHSRTCNARCFRGICFEK